MFEKYGSGENKVSKNGGVPDLVKKVVQLSCYMGLSHVSGEKGGV